jgi:hypothetical protein
MSGIESTVAAECAVLLVIAAGAYLLTIMPMGPAN